MIKVIALQLLTLIPVTLCQPYNCPAYGPEKLKLRAEFIDDAEGFVYIAYSENTDKNGCPKRLTHPYANGSAYEKCKFISKEQDGEYKRENYECDARSKFVELSEKNNWKWFVISN